MRRCHGDLHLANIVAIDEQPMLFDAIEFDAQMATIDMLYDLAFGLMDLLHHDQPRAANIVLNRYLAATRSKISTRSPRCRCSCPSGRQSAPRSRWHG